jgi:hypothetical protein
MDWRRPLVLAFFVVAGCATQPETAGENPPQREERVTPEPSVEQLQQYCEEGNAGACLDLGIRYERGEKGAEQNSDKAFEHYEKACLLGSSHGCYSEALTLLYDQDNAIRALPLLEFTCERADHWPSCVTLGDLHRTGAVFPPDEKTALTLYGRACEGGYHRGCNAYIRHLWTASEQLIGLNDFAEFLDRHCDQGHEMSCAEAADLYASGAEWTGEKIEQDQETAAEYREKLALARRQRIDVDEVQEPPPTEMKRRDVSPEIEPPPPFKPGYIVVEVPEGMKIIVDGVDTGKKTPASVSLLKGGRHTVRLQSESGELTDPKVTWLSSGERVELVWDRSGSESDEPSSDEE